MGLETDDTVRLRGPRRGERSWPARFLPWAGGAALVVVLATGAAWWSRHPATVQQAALPPAAIVAPPAPALAPPRFAPPLASEAEILADQPDHLAVYRFVLQPAVVVLQFPSLGAQALTLNRAAALLEKDGFARDRVLPWAELDARIVAAGGTPETFYYGHDYRAADLVRFLRLATDLDEQEQALQSLVQKLGWHEQGAAGALISLVRQSSAPDLDPTARATILRHELSHGVYFTDSAYAAYCQRFWSDVLTGEERAKFTAFLGREGYDTALSDLIVNETQAYLVHTLDKRFFNASEVGVSGARAAELRRIFVAGMPPGWLRDSTEQRLAPQLIPAKTP